MNQGLTIFLGAIIVGLIAVAVLAGYTSSVASKLPEQNDLIQVFLSGAAVGSFMSWLVTSGMLHGSSFLSMLSADVSALGAGLKGGDSVAAVEKAAGVQESGAGAGAAVEGLSNMVGGFFKAMGVDSAVLQELNVGMPAF
jgi:hypothetical protein